jgi:mannose-1-phosphate guanylyltransferase/mannose-1-phosphate guanylyltransferase/mannose-6-phosphate isomerase
MLAEEDADAVVAILPSDHAISKEEVFATAMKTALTAADSGALTAFGVPPTAPETGYGYIRQGEPFPGIDGCFHLDKFVEKPEHATATRYLASGNYLWNSGMFLFSTRSYLHELERLEPAMLDACRRSLGDAVPKGGFIELPEKPFAACPARSLDRAVMEQTDAAVVIPVDLGWSDVGAWAAVWEVGEKDGSGNVVFGEVETANVRNSLIYNERSSCLEVSGVTGLVVASTAAAVFVAERARSAEIGALVPHLGTDANEQPVSDASVQMADGIQVVKIGCPDIQVVTTPTLLRVIGSDDSPAARS